MHRTTRPHLVVRTAAVTVTLTVAAACGDRSAGAPPTTVGGASAAVIDAAGSTSAVTETEATTTTSDAATTLAMPASSVPRPSTSTSSTTVPIDASTYGEAVDVVVPVGLADGPIGARPGPLFADAGAGSVWVGVHRASAVSRIDPATNTVIATIAIDPTPGSTAAVPPAAPGGGTGTGSIQAVDDAVWVADVGGFVWRIDPSTNRIVARVDVPGLMGEAGLLEAAGSIWSLTGSGARRIDPTTNTLSGVLELGRPRCCNGLQLAATDGAVWLGSDQGAIRIDPVTDREVALTDIEPFGFGARPIGTSGGLVWGVRPLKIWAIDPATNAVVRTLDKPAEVGVLYADSAIVAGDALWVVAAPPGEELGADHWFQLVRFDLVTGTAEHRDLMNAEHEHIVGLTVDDQGDLWATDFARGAVLRLGGG